jgi:mRNA interferase RelE/StbE
MKVEFLDSFGKDLDRLHEPAIKKAVAGIIINCEQASLLKDIPNVKKLKGFKNAYRIRTREYRLGFYFENGVIEFARILNRKDIYRAFP